MIDIHAHILPGLDDGAQDLETSLQMARIAAADDISQIIATPHVISTVFPNSREQILEAANQLRQALQQQKIPLELFPGGEYRLEADLPKRLQKGEILTLNDGGKYLLVELPNNVLPPFFEEVIYDIQLQGVTPIIAHPERNQVIMEKPKILKQLTDRGILAQITAASVIGDFGKEIKKSSWQLIKQGSIHFIASDAHYHSGKRSPKLSEAYAEIKKQAGEQTAQNLFIENTGRVINGLAPIKASDPPPNRGWSQKIKTLGKFGRK
ncbi:MAG: tyrosine-protein phosphatase [Methanobacterium sp.]